MNDIRLKCTRYAEVENDFAKLYIKDLDDNPPTGIITSRGPSFDSITVVDKNAIETKFYMCRIQGTEPDVQDGDWKTRPLIISYSHKEEL